MKMIDRFLSHVNKTDTCWLWTGALAENGYGVFQLNKEKGTQKAHRVSYSEFVSPLQDDQYLDHLCRVRNCVNPNHLEVVTKRQNAVRGDLVNKKRSGLPVGAHKNGRRYQARAYIDGVKSYFGTYDTPIAAHRAYLKGIAGHN